MLAPLLRAADTLAAAPPAPAADALSRQSLIALPSSMVNDPPLARTRTAPAVPTALPRFADGGAEAQRERAALPRHGRHPVVRRDGGAVDHDALQLERSCGDREHVGGPGDDRRRRARGVGLPAHDDVLAADDGGGCGLEVVHDDYLGLRACVGSLHRLGERREGLLARSVAVGVAAGRRDVQRGAGHAVLLSMLLGADGRLGSGRVVRRRLGCGPVGARRRGRLRPARRRAPAGRRHPGSRALCRARRPPRPRRPRPRQPPQARTPRPRRRGGAHPAGRQHASTTEGGEQQPGGGEQRRPRCRPAMRRAARSFEFSDAHAGAAPLPTGRTGRACRPCATARSWPRRRRLRRRRPRGRRPHPSRRCSAARSCRRPPGRSWC